MTSRNSSFSCMFSCWSIIIQLDDWQDGKVILKYTPISLAIVPFLLSVHRWYINISLNVVITFCLFTVCCSSNADPGLCQEKLTTDIYHYQNKFQCSVKSSMPFILRAFCVWREEMSTELVTHVRIICRCFF